MKSIRRYVSISLVAFLVLVMTHVIPSQAVPKSPMDVRALQTCLKEKGSSLDVLVLMDSSRSLRDSKKGELVDGKPWKGSDPEGRRGPILSSSLNILRDLAEDSGSAFRVNLKNFGNNSGDSLKELQKRWKPWTEVTAANSESVLQEFVKNALYEDSEGTDWASGIATAKVDFNQRIYEAEKSGSKSCSIMFWITDGVPSNPDADKLKICSPASEASIDWFRERNILVLGGLLKPKGKDSSLFRPIVEGKVQGKECGQSNESWTNGYVIEANDINSLAWEFVSLVANIRNLVDLEFSNSSVAVDRGTSQIEIYVKGEPSQWEVRAPDGSVFCSSNKEEPSKCLDTTGKTNITTITVTPNDPNTTQGSWKFSSLPATEVKVYGGISVEPNPVQLVIDPPSKTINEGDKVRFFASLRNADGSPFDTSGFKSVDICAILESNDEKVCTSGSRSGEIELLPSKSDTSIPFSAQLKSKNGRDRQYNVSAVVNVVVQESGKFPSLVCEGGSEGDTCRIPDLKNKRSKESVTLRVLEPTDVDAITGQIYIIGFEVTRDDDARDFNFKLTDKNGNPITPGDKSKLFSPNDMLGLEVSFDRGEESQIEGVIKYAVVSNGETVIRQLEFAFSVGDGVPLHILFLLLLAAYILTIAIPYAFLLWSARRRAVLNIPDNSFSFTTSTFQINKDGLIVPTDGNGNVASFNPDYKKLVQVTVEDRTRLVEFGGATVEVFPPKWNPLRLPKTTITIPNCHLLSTYSGKEFSAESQLFSSEIIGEVVVYFENAGNISAENRTVETMTESSENFDFLESSYESTLSNETKAPETPVFGTIIHLVQPYGDREKSLLESVGVLKALIANVNFNDQISDLRSTDLAHVLERSAIEDTPKKSKSKKSKDKGPSEVNLLELEDNAVMSDTDEDEWGGGGKKASGSAKSDGSSKENDPW